MGKTKDPLKLAEKIVLLKQTEHWDYFNQLLKDRFISHHSALETAQGNDIIDLQGRIKELKEILAWFDEEVRQYEQEQLQQLQMTDKSEEY